MRTRLDFREVLIQTLGIDSSRMYFQPSENTKLTYPCCLYKIEDLDLANADDIHYKNMVRYTVTIIDADPDSEYWKKLIGIPYSNFDRYYAADYLNHWVFRIYY